MDTQKKMRQHISSLSDGEQPDADLELALAALQSDDGQQAWHTYHRIGDVLRAQATPELSDGFADQLAERLRAEPAPGKRARNPGAAAGGAAAREEAASEAVAATAKPSGVTVS
jgi:sigma-E factor negative regulatory protein RseA